MHFCKIRPSALILQFRINFWETDQKTYVLFLFFVSPLNSSPSSSSTVHTLPSSGHGLHLRCWWRWRQQHRLECDMEHWGESVGSDAIRGDRAWRGVRAGGKGGVGGGGGEEVGEGRERRHQCPPPSSASFIFFIFLLRKILYYLTICYTRWLVL